MTFQSIPIFTKIDVTDKILQSMHITNIKPRKKKFTIYKYIQQSQMTHSLMQLLIELLISKFLASGNEPLNISSLFNTLVSHSKNLGETL